MFGPTTVLGGYIRQVTGPLEQTLTHGGRPVVSTVYEELQAFWERVDRWSGPGEAALAGPMMTLAQLLTRDGDAVEAVRKGRAEAILTYLKLRPSIRGEVAAGMGEQIRQWRAGERSMAVQQILDQAMGLL